MPILSALATFEESGVAFTWERLLTHTSLDARVAATALQRLYDAGYVDGSSYLEGGDEYAEWISLRLLPRALPLVGVWPVEDTLEAVLSVLDEWITSATDEEERSRLQRLREAAAKVGGPVLAGLLTAVTKVVLGLP